jgi:hypothetical protein
MFFNSSSNYFVLWDRSVIATGKPNKFLSERLTNELKGDASEI